MIEKKIDQIILQFETWLEILRKRTEIHISKLDVEFSTTSEPVLWKDRLNLKYKKINIGELWSDNLFDCAWAHITGEISKGDNLYLKFDPDGEALIFDKNGKPIRGLTNFCCVHKNSYGRPGKVYIPIEELDICENQVDIWADVANNDPFGNFLSGKLKACEIVSRDPRDIKLYYHFGFILDLIENSKNNRALYLNLIQLLKGISGKISLDMNYSTVEEIISILESGIKKGANPYFNIHAIGHSHLDLAWLWPIRESKRKAARTLSTAIRNQNKYKNYIYGISQPQQLEWIKNDYPELFKEFKKNYESNRIELQGGMWVESDVNIPCGESLIRQFAYGKRFYKDEFNFEVKNLWLPDAFGFNAQLPQIMKECGIDYFLTIKLDRNEINEFPFTTFNWIGLDGSSVLAHIPPEKDYNSTATPGSLLLTEKKFMEHGLSNDALLLYGIGDGGGGPGEEHLEFMSRYKDIYGLPTVINNKVENFFEKINVNKEKYPLYKGELYLEKHQGVFTSQAKNKKYNRYIENELSLIESLAALNRKSIDLDDIWKEVLLYQFHDILPGSSIKRVYDETNIAYEKLIDKLNIIKENITDNKNDLTGFNNTSFNRKEYIKYKNNWYICDTKPYSSSILKVANKESNIKVSETCLENENVKIKIDKHGFIDSIILKNLNYEVLKTSVRFILQNDIGDGWDLDKNFLYSTKEILKANKVEIIDEIYKKGYKFVFEFNKSKMIVNAYLKEESKYLEFEVDCDWNETNKMLRVEYQPIIQKDYSSFDIQYGYINRSNLLNNEIELAQIEYCAHKFVDVSENEFGIALLNNCKYGFNTKQGIISMNLLRSQMYPCIDQDKGKHNFKFAIYPHLNNLDNSDVYAQAYFFNRPIYVSNDKTINFDKYFKKTKIIIDWVKNSKDDNILLRTFNPTSSRQNLSLDFKVDLVDFLEEKLLVKDTNFLEYKPFEIKTLIIK